MGKLTALLFAFLISGSVATKDWETFKAAKAIKKESIKAAKGVFKAAIKAGKDKGSYVVDTGFPVGPDPIRVGPTPVCNTVFDDVWEEKCFTKYDNAVISRPSPDVPRSKPANAILRRKTLVRLSWSRNAQDIPFPSAMLFGRSNAATFQSVQPSSRRLVKPSKRMSA